MARTRRLGYTLTEVVVVMALVGLLMAVAVPSYRGHLLRTHRLEAVRALLAAAAEQERFHLVHGHYADHFDDDPAADPPGLAAPALSETGRYVLGIDGADAAGFMLAARPRRDGPQADDLACAVLTLDEAGRRGASDTNAGDATARCWR